MLYHHCCRLIFLILWSRGNVLKHLGGSKCVYIGNILICLLLCWCLSSSHVTCVKDLPLFSSFYALMPHSELSCWIRALSVTYLSRFLVTCVLQVDCSKVGSVFKVNSACLDCLHHVHVLIYMENIHVEHHSSDRNNSEPKINLRYLVTSNFLKNETK